jgi:predicted MFS family arabinose efflux permease
MAQDDPLTAVAASPSLWRHGDFNLLWAGETVSVVGSAITELALPTLAVLQLHAGPFQVGLLAACQRVAFPVMALPVGVLADRLSRKRLMVSADLARCVLLGTIPVLSAFGALQLWELYLLAVLTGGFSVIFDIAYLAYFPSMVGREQVAGANARLEFSFSAAEIAGPGLGGVLIQAVGAARAMAADAASFLVSALLLLQIRRPERPRASRGHPPLDMRQMGREIGDGVRVVRHTPVLRSLVLSMGPFIFCAHGVDAVVIVFAYRVLHFSPGTYGALLTLTGVGSLFGAMMMGRARRALGVGRLLVVSGLLTGGTLALIPVAQVAAPVAVLAVLGLVRGAGGAVNNITQVTVRQLATPERLQARMNAVFRTMYWGAWPLGELCGGAMGSTVGLVPTIAVFGGGSVLAAVAMRFTSVGRLTRFPEPPG